jgi:hypothetical protein
LPVSAQRREKMRSYTDGVGADVWILTETHDGFTTGHAYSHSSAAGRDGHREPEHHWVTIWSKHRLEPVDTSDSKRTAAARVTPESSEPLDELHDVGSKRSADPSRKPQQNATGGPSAG